MRTYEVTLFGKTPLLMHADDIPWSDNIKKYYDDPANSKRGAKGDDRYPAWLWLGKCYTDTEDYLAVTMEMIMGSFCRGAMKCRNGRSSYKETSQSSIFVVEPFWRLMINNGKTVNMAPFRN